jgi:UDP-GlcNAc:undecaprenyl-phosphate GlcNAc-1-phosphate transferase
MHNALFVLCALHIVRNEILPEKGRFQEHPLTFWSCSLSRFPNLSIGEIQEYRPGVIAAKIIILYFSYEVLLAELRGNFGRIAA